MDIFKIDQNEINTTQLIIMCNIQNLKYRKFYLLNNFLSTFDGFENAKNTHKMLGEVFVCISLEVQCSDCVVVYESLLLKSVSLTKKLD